MMNQLFETTLLIILLIQYVGVSGRRHDNAMGSNKHKRRDLIVGSRGANHDTITAEMQNNTEVIAQVGGTATIPCYTHFRGDEVVTWLKKEDDSILTAGGQVYSSVTRYSVAHVRHQKLWELSIREVKQSDAGIYECQLATHPFTSLFFTLRVVEAKAMIQGQPEVHIHTGNRLRLHCSVELATEPPDYIFWFHNNSMVNYGSHRPLKVVKHRFSSSLSISNVTWDDAGAYRCEPHNADSANVTVHVIAGEKQAALYKGQKNGSGNGGSSTCLATTDNYLMAALLIATYYCFTRCQISCSLHRNLRLAGTRL